MKVRDLLNGQPPTVSPHESAGSAWERMLAEGVDHLAVVQDGAVVGVISRHDLGGPSGGAHRRMGRKVGDLMRHEVVTVTPGTSLARAATLMRRHHIGGLPVLDRGRLVGMVTVGHLLELLERSAAVAAKP